MRLIDADAFIQMMEEKCDPESTLDSWVLSVCRGGVKMMPTVDAVPVRRGQWKRHYCKDDGFPDGWQCSVCSEWYFFDHTPNFCPNCGADMRKDGDGNG